MAHLIFVCKYRKKLLINEEELALILQLETLKEISPKAIFIKNESGYNQI